MALLRHCRTGPQPACDNDDGPWNPCDSKAIFGDLQFVLESQNSMIRIRFPPPLTPSRGAVASPTLAVDGDLLGKDAAHFARLAIGFDAEADVVEERGSHLLVHAAPDGHEVVVVRLQIGINVNLIIRIE